MGRADRINVLTKCGTLYAGAVGMNNPESDRYFSKAADLGEKLGQRILLLQG